MIYFISEIPIYIISRREFASNGELPSREFDWRWEDSNRPPSGWNAIELTTKQQGLDVNTMEGTTGRETHRKIKYNWTRDFKILEAAFSQCHLQNWLF